MRACAQHAWQWLVASHPVQQATGTRCPRTSLCAGREPVGLGDLAVALQEELLLQRSTDLGMSRHTLWGSTLPESTCLLTPRPEEPDGAFRAPSGWPHKTSGSNTRVGRRTQKGGLRGQF